jgi:hypothetical protein
MDRETLTRIFAALPDNQMLQALSSMGLNINSDAGGAADFAMDGTEGMGESGNQMKPWLQQPLEQIGSGEPHPEIFSGLDFGQGQPNPMAVQPQSPMGGQPYLDPAYDADEDDQNWLALQQSGGMA